MREDIGRHNAVDKVVGRLLLDGRLPATDLGLYVSGRAGFEIVQKAWAAGFSAVVSVSAPSALAVEAARRAGHHAGRVRAGRRRPSPTSTAPRCRPAEGRRYPRGMPEPLAPTVGLGVLHLFCKVGPLADGEAVAAAVKAAEADDVQVVPVAMLGHKADVAFMALGADLWRLRQLQTELAAAGLEVVDSYVSLTELSEYAQGVPEEMRAGPPPPAAPAGGQGGVLLLPDVEAPRRREQLVHAALRRPQGADVRPRRQRPEVRRPGAPGRHRAPPASTTSSGASRSSPCTPTTSRRSSTRCASTRRRRSTPSSGRSTRAWWRPLGEVLAAVGLDGPA